MKNNHKLNLLCIISLVSMALLSGGCALGYEVLYMRALTTLFGDMFYVHAALLSTFLIGIGIGAKCAYRYASWLYLLEIATGTYALALPWLLDGFTNLPIAVEVTVQPLWMVGCTSLFLAIPSLLIGFSIPLFSAYLKRYLISGLAFQRIYIVYNLGAMCSIFAVEFAIVRLLGITRSLALIGSVNIFICVSLLCMRIKLPKERVQEVKVFSSRETIALALGSFSSALFQMFFLKLCYLVFEPHREVFAIAVMVTMFGLFLGAWGAFVIRIRFSTVLLLVPIVIGSIYSAYWPLLKLYQATASWDIGSELFVLIRKLVLSCLFALAPMCLFGAMLPTLMRNERAVARESGNLLFISSLANAAGYLCFVFVAHPFLKSSVVLVVIAIVALTGSGLITMLRWSKSQWVTVITGIVLITILLSNWKERYFYLAQLAQEITTEHEVYVFKSGAESTTLLRAKDYEWVSYNGHPSIFVSHKGVVNSAEITSGVIATLTAPRLKRALVLGFGTGITAGTVSHYFERTDVVEINKAFYKMMPRLRHANMNIENNQHAMLHLGDGRTFLTTKHNEYDLIINSIPAPTYFSASKIYTVEFYEQVAEALRRDGIFCTWLSVFDMSKDGVMTILSALKSQFAYCDLRLLRGSYYMAVCSRERLRSRRFQDLPSKPIIEVTLQRHFPDIELNDYFNDILLSENIFNHFTPNVVHENTDDFPVLEFMLSQKYHTRTMGNDPFVQQQVLFNINPLHGLELKDISRKVERASVYYRLGSKFFDTNFVPLLIKEPEVKEAWDEWYAGQR